MLNMIIIKHLPAIELVKSIETDSVDLIIIDPRRLIYLAHV